MINIFPFTKEKIFDEHEAYQLLDLFLVITRSSQNEINTLNSTLELYKTDSKKSDAIQVKINLEIQKWSDKVKRLGAKPIALYKIEIPTENHRNYIWEFPNSSLHLID